MKLKKKPTLKLKTNLKEGIVEETVSKPKYTDLKQVMDYTRPLTIFFSGVEYESYLDILYNIGARNFLMSYEYLKGKGHSQLKKYNDMHLFIDSGAFTYMNDPKYKDYTVEQWEKQIHEYLAWAKKHKDSIFAIADLDLQYIVGYEQVYEWRKKYFEPFMLETGIPVCFIYHEDGDEYWEYMCKRYPYVGFSLNVDASTGSADLREKFRVAEKHNSLVQGMASTNTAMLTEFPFYTVDSTTWNVGLKYGEISVWNGTKMSRIKKTEFETKAFPIISRYDMKFDFDAILEEDKTEMIKVNAYAFIAAEKFVHERLKARMYWLKAQVNKVDVDNLPDDFFPLVEEMSKETLDVKKYALKMNINPEFEGAFNLVYDMTVFLNWRKKAYVTLRQEYLADDNKLLSALHDTYVNRIVNSAEEKIEDLINFFTECLSGDSDKLLQLGTNFDRIVKERESYVEEEDTELVDLSSSEIQSRLKNILPAPEDVKNGEAPELEELDREIFKEANIVPTFDDNGKFLKGQTTVRKPKKMYSKKYPKFACDTCYAAARCPEFKAGYVCSYNKMFNRYDTRDMVDIIQAMQGMVEHNLTRMQRAMVMEVINGTIDGNVTSFIDQNTRLLANLKQMYEYGSPEVLKQTKVVRADGSTETSTQLTNPQSGGILERLFSGVVTTKEEDEFTEVEVADAVEDKKKNPRYDTLEETEY